MKILDLFNSRLISIKENKKWYKWKNDIITSLIFFDKKEENFKINIKLNFLVVIKVVVYTYFGNSKYCKSYKDCSTLTNFLTIVIFFFWTLYW